MTERASITRPDTKTYVLDTSVLLADPAALEKFEEHDIVLPVVVLDELEAKRLTGGHLGWAARETLRVIEELRLDNLGDITTPAEVGECGGTVRIEMNHRDQQVLPEQMRGTSNDRRILAVAANLDKQGHDVVLVSKDAPLRIRASMVGLAAEEYRNEQADDVSWSGFVQLEVAWDGVIAKLRDAGQGGIQLDDLQAGLELPVNTGLAVKYGSSSVLARVTDDGRARAIDASRTLQAKVSGKTAEQRIAIDRLTDPTLPIVSVGGPAGTGKSALAMGAALDAVQRGEQSRIVVFRQLYDVGGKGLGALPGDMLDKMREKAGAVFDALELYVSAREAQRMYEDGRVEVLPPSDIRGRTLRDSYVVIDEAQNVELSVLRTYLSRIGENSKVVLTHDVTQRDHPFLGELDGVAAVVAKLKGQREFGHITLQRVERSAVAAMVDRVLGDERS